MLFAIFVEQFVLFEVVFLELAAFYVVFGVARFFVAMFVPLVVFNF